MALHIPDTTIAICFVLYGSTTNIAAGEGTNAFVIPSDMNGALLKAIVARLLSSTLGTGTQNTELQVRKNKASDGTEEDMLSGVCSIDVGERSSETADTPYVINPATANVSTGDAIFVDVDTIPDLTAPKGLAVVLTFE